MHIIFNTLCTVFWLILVKSILITILFFILDGNKSTKERLFLLTLPMPEAQNCFLLFMYYQMYMQCCSIIQIDFVCKKINNQNVCRFPVNNIHNLPMYVTCMCYLCVVEEGSALYFTLLS